MTMAPLILNSCIGQPPCLFECWIQVTQCSPACLVLFSAFLISVSALPLPGILLFQIPLLLVQFFTFILYVDGLKLIKAYQTWNLLSAVEYICSYQFQHTSMQMKCAWVASMFDFNFVRIHDLVLCNSFLTNAVLRRAASFTSSVDTVLLLACLK